jgi:hypothetical protein
LTASTFEAALSAYGVKQDFWQPNVSSTHTRKSAVLTVVNAIAEIAT